MASSTKLQKGKDKKKVNKPEARIERSKIKKVEKLENGGTVEPINYRLITYDVWGNNDDGFWVNQSFKTETVLDFQKGATDEQIIGILKEKGILTDKANKDNIQVDGERDYTLFFMDSEKGMPLFELQNIHEYEMKANGGNLSGSELLKQDYFKTTAPIKAAEVPAQTTAPVEQTPVIDTQIQVASEAAKTESTELKLPDYDTTQEGVLKQHMNGDEVYYAHLQQILMRPLRYEETVGTMRLRKCFLRPYYKIIQ